MSAGAPQAMRAWIGREFALDGVLAAGGGCDAASGSGALASGELVMANDDRVWQALAGTLGQLRQVGAPGAELLWGFEQAVLCTVQREDGAWLGVFTVPKLNDQSAVALREKMDAFKEQRF